MAGGLIDTLSALRSVSKISQQELALIGAGNWQFELISEYINTHAKWLLGYFYIYPSALDRYIYSQHEAEIMNQKPDTAAPRRFFPGRNLKSTLAPSSEDNCAPKQSSSKKNKKRRRGKRGSKKTDELMQEEAASLFEGRCYQEPEFYFCWELHQNTHGPFKGHTILLKIRLLYIHLCQKRFIGVDQVWISHNQDTLN